MKTIAKDVICYDAEWIPCVRTGRLLTGLPESASDDEVRDALWKRAVSTSSPLAPCTATRIALKEKGYDHQFVFGEGTHNPKHGASILPFVLRWLWFDYPRT
jgi:hypothetical protein